MIDKDWSESTLGEICDFVGGGTPSKRNSSFWNGDIPWTSIKDIKGDVLCKTQDFISEEGLNNSSANLASPNEIILATRIIPGRPILSAIETSINQDLKVVKPKIKSVIKFLYWALKTLEPKVRKLSSGTTVLGINLPSLKSIEIDIPPLPIQRAIVAKIEELFSSLDSGIADLAKAQEQLKVYRQAVLKKAFEGELTKEWREKQTDLPTGKDLKEIIKVDFEILVREKRKKNEKQLIDLKEEEIPHLIPDTWVWCNLGDITWFINGDRGKNYPNRSEYVKTGIPWINTGHINPDGSLSAERMNYITREKYKSLRNGKIQAGDLVYCLRGATFGKTAFVAPYTEGSIASSLMIIRSNEKLHKTYLFHFLTSVEGKRQLQRFDNGTAQPNLSANMVRSYAFPLPSVLEQHQIVKEIESRLSVCDKVEESILESLKKAKALRQSILKKAFEGMLLSDDEVAMCKLAADYEPASVLLERIKADRKKK